MLYISDDDEILNWSTGDLNEFPNAKRFKIPFNELIIKEIEVAEPVIENDRYVEDGSGEYVVDISKRLEVYRWNGTNLKLILKEKL